MNQIPTQSGSDRPKRVIKRYSNRKLYDTTDSRYVTLQQIADMVRAGEDVQIIDNATKEDKTEVTLSLIISGELKQEPKGVPLGTLRDLIQERGERILSQLRDGPIGRLIPAGTEGAPPKEGDEPPPPEVAPPKSTNRLQDLVESSRQTLDQWQHAVDERVRAVVPNFSGFRELEAEVARLRARVEALEAKTGTKPGGREGPSS